MKKESDLVLEDGKGQGKGPNACQSKTQAKKPDVFLNLRLRFCFTMLFVVFVICLISMSSMNVYLASSNLQNANYFLSTIAENNGYGLAAPVSDIHTGRGNEFLVWQYKEAEKMKLKQLQSPLNRFLERIFIFRPTFLVLRDFYSARLDSSGRVIKTISPFGSDELNSRAYEIVAAAFASGKREGRFEDFLFRIDDAPYGYLFVVADRSQEYRQEKHLFVGTVTGLIFMLLLAFVIVWNFSRIAVEPVEEAFLRQRNFIADASHELKTPIAVIGANIDVVEQELPGNKWLGYIKTENSRMAELVKNLLYLAKNDADRNNLCMMKFDFANAVEGAALPFESVAMEQGKSMDISVPEEPLWVMGDESHIKQVAVILIDNAIKNSDAGAVIKISVRAEGKKGFLTVYNTGRGIAEKDIPQIFNRFYRADSSRARSTGGYGLGLTIAKSIADSHRGKITVKSEEGKYAEFTFMMPSC